MKVYRVALDGKFGYYRRVSRMAQDRVQQEAQKMYPLCAVEAEERDITPEEAGRINGLAIDGVDLQDPIFA